MTPESDHDILIEMRGKLADIHFNMMQPGGKVPLLETRLEMNVARMNKFDGAVTMAKWIIGIIAGLIVALGGVLFDHILRGK